MPDPLYVALGRALRQARRVKELTQEQIGTRVGMTRTSITNIESGSQAIAVHQLVALARAIGVDPIQLLAGALQQTPADQLDSIAQLSSTVEAPELRRWVTSLASAPAAPSARTTPPAQTGSNQPANANRTRPTRTTAGVSRTRRTAGRAAR
jgi:transcriptional regulator with XRE-family HTH domain